MGFLERARSTRGRHQRQRSVKVDEPIPQGTSTPTPATPASTRPSTTIKSKRKSLFPGIGSNTTSCEAARPRSRSAAQPGFYSQNNTSSRNEQRSHPPNMQFVTGNDSFRFPSPALVNNSTKKTPPTSVAHLPSLTTGGNNSAIFTPGPQETPRKQPPSWNRSHTDPMLSATQQEALSAQANTWDDKQQRPQLKKQKSAWKTFGSFFKGSKQPRQPIPSQFYQIQRPSNDDLAGNTTRGKIGVLDSPIPSPVAKDEPTVARVDSGHAAVKGADSLMPPPNRDAFPMRTSSRVSANFFEPMPDSAGHSSGGDPQRTPRLDISIPDAGFDRYSVMFEKLLEPKVPLIERRKSKRLNNKDSGSPVDGPGTLIAKEPSGLQRSMTSPSLNRAPSLTIHIADSNRGNRASTVPNPSKAPVVSHRPQAPRRSMTTPVNDSTPVSITPESKTPNTAIAAPLPASTTTASSPRCSIMSENSLPPTPNTATSLASSINTTVFGPSSSSPPKESARNQASSSQNYRQQDEDAPPVPPLPTRSNDRPALLRNPPSGTERFERQIVQVSVARQVSVSKARRRVADAAEAKQPLRPRVVELGKNRKSTLVLIEGGD